MKMTLKLLTTAQEAHVRINKLTKTLKASNLDIIEVSPNLCLFDDENEWQV